MNKFIKNYFIVFVAFLMLLQTVNAQRSKFLKSNSKDKHIPPESTLIKSTLIKNYNLPTNTNNKFKNSIVYSKTFTNFINKNFGYEKIKTINLSFKESIAKEPTSSISKPLLAVPPPPVPDYMVLGFYVKYGLNDKSSYNSLKNYGSYLNTVSFASYDISSTGEVALSFGAEPSEGIDLANSTDKDTYALFINKDFKIEAAHTLLANSSYRKKAVSNVVSFSLSKKYKGINMDFEGLYGKDRPLYNQFISELSILAHANGLKVMVSVPPKTKDCLGCSWNGAFDYSYLGKVADYVQVMTYDEHGPWGKPGSIASYSFVENVLNYSISQISSRKIVMGVPGYAYDWNLDSLKHNTAHAASKFWNNSYAFDNNRQSAFFSYTSNNGDKHVVWFENETSILNKSSLVKKYNLAGVGMWRMGHENEELWKAIKQALQ